MRRVGFRIGPHREPGKVKAGGIQEAENGLGAARVKGMSRKPATGTPVTASGCNRPQKERTAQH